MEKIQKLFEKLAGITQDELARIHLAAEVFRITPPQDLSELEIPACWRRPRRCQGM